MVKARLEMLCDLERVRAALRAGARPQQICGINSLTRRAIRPDTVAHGPEGDLLILARWGRMTPLGHIWDELERASGAGVRALKRGKTQSHQKAKELSQLT